MTPTRSSATLEGAEHHTTTVNGTTLHHVSAGDHGSPVVLVHGFPESWWAFRGLIPLLAAEHRVHAVDLRGFGDSAVAGREHTAAVAAQDLDALIDHLGLGPVHLLGQDLSGGVVFRTAAQHPESLLSLTGVETGLAGFGAEGLADVTRGGAWYIGALATPGVRELVLDDKVRDLIAEHLYPAYGLSRDALGPEDADEFVRTYDRVDGLQGASALYRSLLDEGDELRALAAERPLSMPVLAVGSFGGDFTASSLGAVSARPVQSVRLDGVGHYVAQEAPGRLAAVLLDFYRRVDEAALGRP